MELGPTSRPLLDLATVRYITQSRATQFYFAHREDANYPDVGGAELTSGRVMVTRPLVFTVRKGGRAGDFIWSDTVLIVAGPRVIELFESERFTGFSTFPVEMRAAGRRLEGYKGISVLGRAGPLDPDRSMATRVPRETGGYGISAIKGLVFDPRNWDGTDIFSVNEFPGAMLVVERVWRALKKARVTGYEAEPLEDFGYGY